MKFSVTQIQNNVEKALIFPNSKRPFWNNIYIIWYRATIKFYIDPEELEEFHIPLQNYLRY